MTKEEWEVFREEIEAYDQELPVFYKDEEWWISRVPEEKSFLLTRSKDSYTQEFYTAEELFTKGIVDGKAFIKRVSEFYAK